MANPKRPDKIKFSLVKAPAQLVFSGDLLRRDSIYCAKLTEALNSDQVLEVMAEDKYLQGQLKIAAKKLKLRLVYGRIGEKIYVKPVAPSDQEQRLILLLREPRTVNELGGHRLELHVENTLQRMAEDGTAHVVRGKWVLTEKGMDLLPQRAAASA